MSKRKGAWSLGSRERKRERSVIRDVGVGKNSFVQTYAPNKNKRFKSGFGFSIFRVFGLGFGFGFFSNLLQISN